MIRFYFWSGYTYEEDKKSHILAVVFERDGVKHVSSVHHDHSGFSSTLVSTGQCARPCTVCGCGSYVLAMTWHGSEADIMHRDIPRRCINEEEHTTQSVNLIIPCRRRKSSSCLENREGGLFVNGEQLQV